MVAIGFALAAAALAFRPVAMPCARLHRPPVLSVSAVTRITCAERPTGAPVDAPVQRRPSLRRRILQWWPLRRASLSFAMATALVFGGAGPSYARRGPEPLPHTTEVEQMFLRKKWNRQNVEAAGIKSEDILEKVIWKDEKMSEAQRIMYEMMEEQEDDDSERLLGIVKFVGLSTLGIAIIGDGVKRIDRYLKKREAAEKQLEIELTGTYTNPFAGDVDEIVNPITGEKTKIKKPDSDDDGMGTYKSPNAPKKDGDGDDTPPDASGIDVDDVDDEGKSNIDVLSDLL